MSSRLDYCNSVLYGIADTDLTILKRIQNRPACIVTKSPSFTHNVPLLCTLHWLPVKFRILFKISLFTYETLHEKQLVYLHFMLAASVPCHSLRSSKGISLSAPSVKTKMGASAFHSLCPISLEQLPAVCPFSHFCCYLQETSRDTSLTWHFLL